MMVRATRTGHCLTGLVDLDAYKNVVTDEDERKQKTAAKDTKSAVFKAAPPFGLDAPIWKERDRSTAMTWGGDVGLFALAAVSLGLVLANKYTYLVAFAVKLIVLYYSSCIALKNTFITPSSLRLVAILLFVRQMVVHSKSPPSL